MKKFFVVSSLLVLSFLISNACTPPCKDWCVKKETVVKVTTLDGIMFDFDKSEIKPAAKPILDNNVQLLKQDAKLSFRIEGHTDSIGSDAYNQRLSEKRAKVVYDYFLSQGIPAGRMSTTGFGKTQPKVSNDTPENRSINRRIEIKIIKTEVK